MPRHLLILTLLAVPALAGSESEPVPSAEKPVAVLPSWSEFTKQQLLRCQAPLGSRTQPVERQIAGAVYRLEGGLLERTAPRADRVVLGVLGAIKDVDEDTRANLLKAAAAFRKAKVDAVVVNGDIALHQFDLQDAMLMLGELGFPTFVLIGNSEGRGAFNRAFMVAAEKHPNLFNLNWTRHVKLGPIDLVSLPGYYDRVFIAQSSGCSYRGRDLLKLERYVDELNRQGGRPVLISHGPPRSTGTRAIDRAHEAGNVGDPAMAELIENSAIHVGLFSHILEAGGRASNDLKQGKPAKPGKRHPRLYVNSGAASAMPWGMLDGSEGRGQAMIVTIDAKGASYRVLKLR